VFSQGTEIWAAHRQSGHEIQFPTVPGYQSIGVIEDVGAEVTSFTVGQRVMFASSRLAEHFPPTWMGAHVSHALVPATGERAPLVIPEGTDSVAAALSALPAVALRGNNMLNIEVGDLVVVTGQGLIGQGNAQLAKLRGATVVATDIGAKRLELSKSVSADVVVNVKEENLEDVVRSIKPEGADIVIETTGRSDQFAPCIDLLRPSGAVTVAGVVSGADQLRFSQNASQAPDYRHHLRFRCERNKAVPRFDAMEQAALPRTGDAPVAV
jgi:threonine dehydrogenase-like Zn-dependent dehydrogenase